MIIPIIHRDPVICASMMPDEFIRSCVFDAYDILMDRKVRDTVRIYRNWSRSDIANRHWLYVLTIAMCAEYKYRFAAEHPWSEMLDNVEMSPAPILPIKNVPMPRQLQAPTDLVNPIQAHRRYCLYMGGKYTKRLPPEWMSKNSDAVRYHVIKGELIAK